MEMSPTSILALRKTGRFKALRALSLLSAFLAFGGIAHAGGWYVGNTDTGEWVEYQRVYLSAGSYRFTARAGATVSTAKMHLLIDGVSVTPALSIPSTGRADAFVNVHLGSKSLSQGYHTLRVMFDTPGASLDWVMLKKDPDISTVVKATDTQMVRPPTSGMLLSPVVSISEQTDANSMFTADDGASVLGIPETDANSARYTNDQLMSWYRAPMFRDFDRRTDRFWDIMVDQLLASRAQVPLIHCRGTIDFTHDLQDRAYRRAGGSFEGRWLKKFTEAVARSPQAASSLQIGLFWENGGLADEYHQATGTYPSWGSTDFADYSMQYWLEPWLDQVPASMLYQPLPSRPIISVWSGRPQGIVSDGQMGTFLANIRSRIISKYGLNPIFVLPVGGDVDAAAQAQGWGQASWVTWDGPMLTLNAFAGRNWGTVSAGSKRRLDTAWLNDWNPATNSGTPGGDSPGVSSYQSPLNASGESVLLNNLKQARAQGARLIQEEGFYNISEGNAVFRSYAPGWTFPNQHLAALREHADPETQSLIFEAEACDTYSKTSAHENLGGSYRRHWYSSTGLDVYRPLHNLNSWVTKNSGPGTLTQISAGFFDVWALDSAGKIWAQPISGTPNTWVTVGMNGIPKFDCLSVSKHFAWAINGTSVYCCRLPGSWDYNAHTDWTLQTGSMTQLSATESDVWAINSSGAIYRRPVHAVNDTTHDWSLVSGPTLTKITANSAFVWGMNGSNIYFSPTAAISWTTIPNPYNLTQISVGSEEVWGVNAAGNIYRRSASGIGGWDAVDGSLTKVSVGENYVLGLSGTTPMSRKIEGFQGAPVATVPATPTGLTSTAGNASVSLTWTPSPGAAGYHVKRATNSGGPYTTITDTTGETVADTGLTNGTTYYYVVSAFNGTGESANSSQISRAPSASGTVPAVPTGVTATAGGSDVTLTWTASAGATSYQIKRSSLLGGPYTTIASGITPTTYTDSNVLADTKYYYVISAINGTGGNFADSESVDAMPTGTALSRTGWIASASNNTTAAAKAIDGNATTRWDTGGAQASGQWFKIDMGSVKPIYKIVLDATASGNDYPRGYQVHVSIDGTNWGSPVASGNNASAVTTLTFPQVPARYIRVTQTGSAGNYWSIHEFYAYAQPSTLNRTGWLASASNNTGNAAKALDGNDTTRWDTAGSQVSGQWFKVDMTSPQTIDTVVLDATASGNDYPRGYQVHVSSDDSNWGSPIATGTASSAVTTITFPQTTARYIRITQTGSVSNYWSIHEFYAYAQTPSLPLSIPVDLIAKGRDGQVDLAWSDSFGSPTSYQIKRGTSSAGPFTLIGTSTSPAYTDFSALNRTTYYYVISALKGTSETANSSPVAGMTTLAAPWADTDIGTLAFPGTVNLNSGVFTVKGSGADIWGTADAFNFIHQSMTGDCTIIARVTGIQNTNAWAKAGVMIRETLDAGSKHASMVVTPGAGISSQRRLDTDSSSSFDSIGLNLPYWVRVQRNGSTFTASYSPDGTTWTTMTTVTISMSANVYVGLAVTSHDNTMLTTATFDNVTVSASGSLVTNPPSGDNGPGSGTGNGSELAPDADQDGDGVSNSMEQIAGTDPYDPQSVFKISSSEVTDHNDFVVNFNSVLGKTYVLEKSTTIGPDAKWETLQDDIAGTGFVISLVDQDALTKQSRCFYRVRVKQ